MKEGTNRKIFLDILRAGLWENEVKFSTFGTVDCVLLYRLSEEQSVAGLVAAGIEKCRI